MRRKPLILGLLRAAKHSFLAMTGGPLIAVLSAVPIGAVWWMIGLKISDSWYLPTHWWPGLVLGFLLNRRYLHRAACLTWVSGLVWLAYGIPNVQPQTINWAEVRLALFPLDKNDCSMSECLYVLLFTWPALNAAAYSLGAFLGLICGRRPNTGLDPYKNPTSTRFD